MATDLAYIRQLMALATGDEKHDGSAHSTFDVLWVLYDRVLHYDAKNPRSEERDRLSRSRMISAINNWAAISSVLGRHTIMVLTA